MTIAFDYKKEQTQLLRFPVWEVAAKNLQRSYGDPNEKNWEQM